MKKLILCLLLCSGLSYANPPSWMTKDNPCYEEAERFDHEQEVHMKLFKRLIASPLQMEISMNWYLEKELLKVSIYEPRWRAQQDIIDECNRQLEEMNHQCDECEVC